MAQRIDAPSTPASESRSDAADIPQPVEHVGNHINIPGGGYIVVKGAGAKARAAKIAELLNAPRSERQSASSEIEPLTAEEAQDAYHDALSYNSKVNVNGLLAVAQAQRLKKAAPQAQGSAAPERRAETPTAGGKPAEPAAVYACQTKEGCHGRPECQRGCEGIAARLSDSCVEIQPTREDVLEEFDRILSEAADKSMKRNSGNAYRAHGLWHARDLLRAFKESNVSPTGPVMGATSGELAAGQSTPCVVEPSAKALWEYAIRPHIWDLRQVSIETIYAMDKALASTPNRDAGK